MKKFFSMLVVLVMTCFAENPIVQSVFTADPAPMVLGDTLFVYTSHDEDVLINNFFTMLDWKCFSTTDMVNWRSRGTVASLKNFKWAGTNGAWAVQCVQRGGKFYMYCPIHMKGIGVLVSDSPTGPFTDPIGKALCTDGGNDIDPTVFVDSDNQAYLYYGNPECRYVKLNTDMVSFSGGVNKVPMTVASFGQRTKTDRATSYEEGPWFYKRDSRYYLMFAGGPLSEHLAYSTSTGPTGPWVYGGVVMPAFSGGAFTNHPGIAEFKGNSYLFYHSQKLSNNGYKRSVCVEKFNYNADGTIPKITPTSTGAPQIGTLNPYDTTQAETICQESGVETNACSEGGVQVDSINNGDYIRVKGVDFKDGAKAFDARVASGGSGGNIELRLDSQTGTPVGTCAVTGAGGWQTWVTKTCTISGATGKHDLFLKFTGGSGFLFNFNWWKFTPTVTSVNGVDANMSIKSGSLVIATHITGATQSLRLRFSPTVSKGNMSVRLFDLHGRMAELYRGAVSSSGLVLPLDRAVVCPGVYRMSVVVSGESLLASTIVVR